MHARRRRCGDEGFDGHIMVVDEPRPHPPYDRPPLSKQVLSPATGTPSSIGPAGRPRATSTSTGASGQPRPRPRPGRRRGARSADGERARLRRPRDRHRRRGPRACPGTDGIAGVHVAAHPRRLPRAAGRARRRADAGGGGRRRLHRRRGGGHLPRAAASRSRCSRRCRCRSSGCSAREIGAAVRRPAPRPRRRRAPRHGVDGFERRRRPARRAACASPTARRRGRRGRGRHRRRRPTPAGSRARASTLDNGVVVRRDPAGRARRRRRRRHRPLAQRPLRRAHAASSTGRTPSRWASTAARRLLRESDGLDEPDRRRSTRAVVLVRPVRPQDPAGRPLRTPTTTFEVVHGSIEERRFVGALRRAGKLVGVLGHEPAPPRHAAAPAAGRRRVLRRRRSRSAAASSNDRRRDRWPTRGRAGRRHRRDRRR